MGDLGDLGDSQASRYLVVSADCHAGASVAEYRDYLESRHLVEFDEWVRQITVPFDDLADGDELGTRNWDSDRRLRELESDGVVGEVVYANTVPPFHSSSPLVTVAAAGSSEWQRRWAGLQAHNRWLVDFCLDAKGRRAGTIHICFHDVAGSVREIYRAAGAGMTGGVLLPGAPPGSGVPPLHDPSYYEPIWAACAETGFPVNCHSGGAAPPPVDTAVAHVLFLLEMSWWDQSVLRNLLLGGVLERHPALQLVFTEAGVAWVDRELNTLEQFFDSMSSADGSAEVSSGARVCSQLSARPREFWRRQCHVGASFMHPSDTRFIEALGVHSIMWGSDYPHNETSYPYSKLAIASTFCAVPADQTAAILGLNAARLYRLDEAALRDRADLVGPRVDTVQRGVSAADIPAGATRCPAFAGLVDASEALRWGDNRRPSRTAEVTAAASAR